MDIIYYMDINKTKWSHANAENKFFFFRAEFSSHANSDIMI